jgi:type II secretory pathway pseudopilin PulG
MPPTGEIKPGATRRRPPLTLVESVVVAVFLGILAMAVVPKFAPANMDRRAEALEANLSLVRGAIEAYRTQHGGRNPALETFPQQLTTPTTKTGAVAADPSDETAFGPYLLAVPNNPYTNTNTVGRGEPGTSAWYYNPTTGEFRANDSAANRRR